MRGNKLGQKSRSEITSGEAKCTSAHGNGHRHVEISSGEAKSPRKERNHTGTREVYFSAIVHIHIFLGRAAVLQVRRTVFYGAAHLCLSDSELSARKRLDDKTVQVTYRKHIFLGCAAVLQVRRTVLSARCSVFRVHCSFTGEVLRF